MGGQVWAQALKQDQLRVTEDWCKGWHVPRGEQGEKGARCSCRCWPVHGCLALAGSLWLGFNRSHTQVGVRLERPFWPLMWAGIGGRELEWLQKLGYSNRWNAFLFPDVPEEL